MAFHCPLKTLQERLLERGKSSGRQDDNLETIQKRFHTFQTSHRIGLDAVIILKFFLLGANHYLRWFRAGKRSAVRGGR